MADELPGQYLLRIERQLDIRAKPATVFEVILDQCGPGFEQEGGKKMPMRLEAWPGGRWYRDLGSNAGHFWGHVQVIKPPTLLELTGPMFMSYPVSSHVQYKLAEHEGGTRLSFLHRAIGEIDPNHRAGATAGWEFILNQIKTRSTN